MDKSLDYFTEGIIADYHGMNKARYQSRILLDMMTIHYVEKFQIQFS